MFKHINLALFAILIIGTALLLRVTHTQADTTTLQQGQDLMNEKPKNHPTLTLAGGCFWCLESEFRALDGVLYTYSGYIGGELQNPSYQDITTGSTEHAEAVEITYDPEKISKTELLEFFLTKAHDPTQLNRQGVDIGTQYRSAIFYTNEEEKILAEEIITALNQSIYKTHNIVTTLEPYTQFWPAEEYHQQYYEKYEEENGRPHIRILMKKQGKL